RPRHSRAARIRWFGVPQLSRHQPDPHHLGGGAAGRREARARSRREDGMTETATPARATPATGTARIDVDGEVATVLLDRPGKLNALTPEMLEALEGAVAAAGRSDARVVVVRGAGEKA